MTGETTFANDLPTNFSRPMTMTTFLPFLRPLTLAISTAIVGISVASPKARAQSDERTLSGTDVAIYNIAGRVRVERGTGSDVTVQMTRGGRDAGALSVAVSEVRGRNSYRVLYPQDDDIIYSDNVNGRNNSSSESRIDSDGTWGHGERGSWRGSRRVRVKTRGSGTEAWADLTIRVPAGKSVSVYLMVGELTATQITSDLRLDVSSARVSATDIRGKLVVDAGSGRVDIRSASGASISVDNGSGSVSLNNVSSDDCTIDTGSGGVSGTGVQCKRLHVDVGSGGVRMAEVTTGDVFVDTGSGSIDLGLLSSPSKVAIESGSGGVTLSLPSSFSATLDVQSGSGGISTDFPVTTTRMSRNHLRGTIGDGAGNVRIETGSGSIRLRKN